MQEPGLPKSCPQNTEKGLQRAIYIVFMHSTRSILRFIKRIADALQEMQCTMKEIVRQLQSDDFSLSGDAETGQMGG